MFHKNTEKLESLIGIYIGSVHDCHLCLMFNQVSFR